MLLRFPVMNCSFLKAGTLAKKMYTRNSKQRTSSAGVKLLTAGLCGIEVFCSSISGYTQGSSHLDISKNVTVLSRLHSVLLYFCVFFLLLVKFGFAVISWR